MDDDATLEVEHRIYVFCNDVVLKQHISTPMIEDNSEHLLCEIVM